MGILAAAGLVALETGLERLAEDHARAARLARGLAGIAGIELNPSEVETNIVILRLTEATPDAPSSRQVWPIHDSASAWLLNDSVGPSTGSPFAPSYRQLHAMPRLPSPPSSPWDAKPPQA